MTSSARNTERAKRLDKQFTWKLLRVNETLQILDLHSRPARPREAKK